MRTQRWAHVLLAVTGIAMLAFDYSVAGMLFILTMVFWRWWDDWRN